MCRVNLVEHPPVASEPSAIDSREFLSERLAHTSRLIQQRPGNELSDRRCHVRSQNDAYSMDVFASVGDALTPHVWRVYDTGEGENEVYRA